MRIAFIGCVRLSHDLLARVLSLDPRAGAEVVGVITKNSSPFHSDFCSLAPLAKKHGLRCLVSKKANSPRVIRWLRSLRPDVIYCFGWSELLGPELRSLAPIVGFHPSELPKNRGRHPLIWALALGLRRTASTFFFMDGGADSGKILDQRVLYIRRSDDANSLYRRITAVATDQIVSLTKRLTRSRDIGVKQDRRLANVWRKRTYEDGRIDWRMSANAVYDLIRALTRPYAGAHCRYQGRDVRLWKSRAVACRQINVEPGKVLGSGAGHIVVKCGHNALRILKHDFVSLPKKGEYL